MIPVIICGGIGTKMWPLSSPRMPKQFLPFISGKSLFEINWESLRNRYQPEEIYIQTNHEQAKIAKHLIPEIPEENFFYEPESRNQGPATGLIAALLIKAGKGTEPFFLIQVDVLRNPVEKVFAMMDLSEKLALETNKYITGGFIPNRFVNGVDFLLKGRLVDEMGGVKIFKVAEYIDRNDEEKIKKYIDTGKLLVHTNHTSITPNNLLRIFKKHKPEWHKPLLNITVGEDIGTEFRKMPKGALEEVTQKVYSAGESLVVELPFSWTDFGTWESLDRYYKDSEMTPTNGGVVEIDSNNNFCYSETKKRIAVIGLSNVIIVEGKDGILVCKKEKSGKVGQVV